MDHAVISSTSTWIDLMASRLSPSLSLWLVGGLTFVFTLLPSLQVFNRLSKKMSFLWSIASAVAAGVVMGAVLFHMIPDVVRSASAYQALYRFFVQYRPLVVPDIPDKSSVPKPRVGNVAFFSDALDKVQRALHVPQSLSEFLFQLKGHPLYLIGLTLIFFTTSNRVLGGGDYSLPSSNPDFVQKSARTRNKESRKIMSPTASPIFHAQTNSAAHKNPSSISSLLSYPRLALAKVTQLSSLPLPLIRFLIPFLVDGFTEGFSLSAPLEPKAFLFVTVSLMIHKIMEATLVGMEIKMYDLNRLTLVTVATIYAFLNKLGALVASSISRWAGPSYQKDIVTGLNSVSTGTFLYLTFVLVTEAIHQPTVKEVMVNSAVLLATFTVMAVLLLYYGRDDDEP